MRKAFGARHCKLKGLSVISVLILFVYQLRSKLTLDALNKKTVPKLTKSLIKQGSNLQLRFFIYDIHFF